KVMLWMKLTSAMVALLLAGMIVLGGGMLIYPEGRTVANVPQAVIVVDLEKLPDTCPERSTEKEPDLAVRTNKSCLVCHAINVVAVGMKAAKADRQKLQGTWQIVQPDSQAGDKRFMIIQGNRLWAGEEQGREGKGWTF